MGTKALVNKVWSTRAMVKKEWSTSALVSKVSSTSAKVNEGKGTKETDRLMSKGMGILDPPTTRA